MKIKSKLKKLRNEFKLSHVLWFFIGILITVAFNWIVYKDPKRITAPGVSALVAMSTFMLALWSAFKVNKWINSKVNEKSFKRTEEFLDELSSLYLGLAKLYSVIEQIKDTKDFANDKILLGTAKDYINEYLNSIVKTTVLYMSFSHWNIKFKKEMHFESIDSRLVKITKTARVILFNIDNIQQNADNTKEIKNINLRTKLLLGRLDGISILLDPFITLKYNEIFDH